MPDTQEATQVAAGAALADHAASGLSNTLREPVADKDRPLWDDTRLLGRILGDTVREQHGERIFDIIERIRQTSIRFRRDEDEAARQQLGEMMLSFMRESRRLINTRLKRELRVQLRYPNVDDFLRTVTARP